MTTSSSFNINYENSMFREALMRTSEIAEKHGVQQIFITLEWNNRFTARIGDARYFKGKGYGRVRLSSKVWPNLTEWARRETMVHEIAHIYANKEMGRNAQHGAAWRKWMKRFGYPSPSRTCDVTSKNFVNTKKVNDDIVKRKNTRYQMICPQCKTKIIITKNRRTRWIKANSFAYRHISCGSAIHSSYVKAKAKEIRV